MEWFALTSCGLPDSIKDMMRSDYKEPEVQPEVKEILAQELTAILDCHIGRVDGYAYKSYDRLVRMRRKGVFKPVGPNEMYNYAGTDAMKAGFWNRDPALKGEDWYKKRIFEPKPSTDVTKYVNDAKKIDKFFRL